MLDDVYETMNDGVAKALKALGTQLSKLRTGRANLALFDGIRADYYGVPTPLNQMASISVWATVAVLLFNVTSITRVATSATIVGGAEPKSSAVKFSWMPKRNWTALDESRKSTVNDSAGDSL